MEKQSTKRSLEKGDILGIAAFCLLFAAYGVTRLYRIMEVPRGLHVDEVGMAYDAWSLAVSGVDRWGISFPVYLRNFGGGQSALYAYLLMLLIRLAGWHDWLIRMPAVLMGGVMLLFTMLTAKECFESRKAGILAGVLVVILPFFLMSQRWGLDCNLLADMMAVLLWGCVKIIKTQKYRYYFFTGLAAGISLYSYALSWLIVPLFLLLFVCYELAYGARGNRKFFTRNSVPARGPAASRPCTEGGTGMGITVKKLVLLGLPAVLAAFPLLAFLLVNSGCLEPFMLSGFTVDRLPGYRGSEVSLANIWPNLAALPSLVTHDPLPYNAFEKYWVMYPVSVLLLPAGLFLTGRKVWACMREKRETPLAVPVIGFVSVFLTMLVVFEPNINKANALYAVCVLLLTGVLMVLLQRRRIFMYGCMAVYVVSFLFFARYYYTRYEEDCYPQRYFNDNFTEAVDYVTREYLPDEEKTVYVNTQSVENPYIYIMLSQKLPYTEWKDESEAGRYRILLPNYDYDNGIYQMEGDPDEDGVYVIQGNEGMDEILAGNGFALEEYGGYHIYIKK